MFLNRTNQREREREREKQQRIKKSSEALSSMAAKGEKLLTKVAESFKELANCVDSPTPHLEVGQFASACRLVASIIGYLGMAFKFASIEFSAKVIIVFTYYYTLLFFIHG